MKILTLCLTACALAAQQPSAAPGLTAAQTQTAIAYGTKFRGQDKYFRKALQKKTIELAATSPQRQLTVVGNWDLIAAKASEALLLMRPLPGAGTDIRGNLHALIRITELGKSHAGTSDRYAVDRTNCVIQTKNATLQPIRQAYLRNNEVAIATHIALLYDFEVPPDALSEPVVVTFIDGSGKRSWKKIDLSRALDIPTPAK